MKTKQFIQLLSALPTTASCNEAKSLEQFIEQYPWCGIAHQLLLESLQQSGDERLSDYIPKAAIYAVYREQLYHRLRQLKTQSVVQVEETVSLSKDEDAILEIEDERDEKELTVVTSHSSSVTEVAAKPKPLFISSPSDYFCGEVIEVEEGADPIVRFIIERPKIRPVAGALSGITLPNQIEQLPPPKNFEDIVTETLAKIYEDQGLVSLAKATYEKLRLLEPKKSAYFAALIQNLKFKS